MRLYCKKQCNRGRDFYGTHVSNFLPKGSSLGKHPIHDSAHMKREKEAPDAACAMFVLGLPGQQKKKALHIH